METTDTVVAVFAEHQAADAAVKKLAEAGFEMKKLSVAGKGYHTDEQVVGFYNVGDRNGSDLGTLRGTRAAYDAKRPARHCLRLSEAAKRTADRCKARAQRGPTVRSSHRRPRSRSRSGVREHRKGCTLL